MSDIIQTEVNIGIYKIPEDDNKTFLPACATKSGAELNTVGAY